MDYPDRKQLGPLVKRKSSMPKHTREMLFLAEQSAEGKIKVLPGNEWAVHYPSDQEIRKQKLQGLLEGKYTAQEVAKDIKPDALFYNVDDIQKEGLTKVSDKIKDLSAFISHYDYPRFTRFVESMRNREIPLDTLDKLYTEITQARVQKKVRDAYGYTGRKQIENAWRYEAEEIISGIKNLTRKEKVLKTLKIDWLCDKQNIVLPEERDRMISELSGDEREVFEKLHDSYQDFIQNGSEKSFQELTKNIKEDFPKIQKKIETGKSSENMESLEQELEEYMEQVVPPGTPEDPAIAPEDQDEYHTPPPANQESNEKMQNQPIFEIEPALAGYYASGRKSYFDIQTKTWSKKKKLSAYNTPLNGPKRYKISGNLNSGLKTIPIPNGYALDVSSLKTSGAQVEIKRDQNGCFYFEAQGQGSFSVDFLKEATPLAGKPFDEDTASLYQGLLSTKTENKISRLKGTNLQKAEQARQYILANHFYPGGGDLQMAQALQYKLRSKSTGSNYLQNIDQSEYLECYSANTKFIAMVRKAGVPARLVFGYKVEGTKHGKSAITQSTGHAWAEVWDGQSWRRFDSTPRTKPEDKKKSEDKNQESDQQEANEAEDGGIEQPQAADNQDGQKKSGKKQNQPQVNEEQSESNNPLDQMTEASDQKMQQSQSQIQQVKEQMGLWEKQKQEMEKKIQETDKFQELSELEKQLEESDLPDELQKEIEEKIEAKEELMKDKIKDELDQMVEDGFLDEEKRDQILEELKKKELELLDHLQKKIEIENHLYNQYEEIKEDIIPLVDKRFRYFAERLPRQDEINLDEDSLTRRGTLNRRAVMKPRNLVFGLVKNPREIKPSVKPRFMASVLIDVSGSMDGEKLNNARKLLVFYAELFSRISEAFGYIRFSIDIFSDSVTEIKGFEQDYDSPQRYDFTDGSQATIKYRLIQQLTTQGGTNMLEGIKKAANELNKQTEEYPDYASAFYFVGDGGDTCGNTANIKEFLKINDKEHGFGEHMYSAILLGNESQRRELADIFGEEHTNVAPNFDDLIEQSMDKFDEDITDYLKNKTQYK